MEPKTHKRLPKILKINRIDKKRLRISVLFSTGEDRILDFENIFREEWKITKTDPEYRLLQPEEFGKIRLQEHTLCWPSLQIEITGFDGRKQSVAYSVGADTLYGLSQVDEKRRLSVGALFKQARLAANLSQEQVAELAGTSRTYITRLESDQQDIELMTLKKLVEAGLNKHLNISIV